VTVVFADRSKRSFLPEYVRKARAQKGAKPPPARQTASA
jgi:hypothetical protein